MKKINFKPDKKTLYIAAAVLATIILLAVVLGKYSVNSKDDSASLPVLETRDYSSMYSVTFDSSVFVSEKKNGVEKIKCTANSEAYMTISHVEGFSFSEYIDDVLSNINVNINDKNIKLEGNENSLGVRYSTGSFENDIITTIYAVDDGAGECFEIRYINTIGDDDDLGAKFNGIAQSFKLKS